MDSIPEIIKAGNTLQVTGILLLCLVALGFCVWRVLRAFSTAAVVPSAIHLGMLADRDARIAELTQRNAELIDERKESDKRAVEWQQVAFKLMASYRQVLPPDDPRAPVLSPLLKAEIEKHT